jgi:hypothetical protein
MKIPIPVGFQKAGTLPSVIASKPIPVIHSPQIQQRGPALHNIMNSLVMQNQEYEQYKDD